MLHIELRGLDRISEPQEALGSGSDMETSQRMTLTLVLLQPRFLINTNGVLTSVTQCGLYI